MVEAVSGNAAGHDFAFFGLEFSQSFGVFEIDVIYSGFAKAAAFGFGSLSSAADSFLHFIDSFQIYKKLVHFKFIQCQNGTMSSMPSEGLNASSGMGGIGGAAGRL